MRSILTLVAIAACITTACKDETPEPEKQDEKPGPKEVITEITSELSEADSISSFVTALKSIQLTQEEVSQGLTVFAPLNTVVPASGQASREPRGPLTKAATKAGEDRKSTRLNSSH